MWRPTLLALLVPVGGLVALSAAKRVASVPHAAALRGGRVRMDDTAAQDPIPITLLSGFLGAGKTTLLKHLLQNTDGVRVGVVVNDVAAVNVDAKLVKGGASQGLGGGLPEDMIELSNGCACCSAGDDLFGALAELVSLSFMRGTTYDFIVFEASGVSEPRLLRAMFQEAAAAQWPLMRAIRLESMVTVVDAASFLELYSSTDSIAERSDLGYEESTDDEALMLGMPPGAPPSVVQLLIEQVETADVLVLNKVDNVDDAGLSYLKDALGAINGFAELMPTTFGVVPPYALLMRDREAGVALSNEVMDHQSSVDFAQWLESQQNLKGALTSPPAAETADEPAAHEHSHEAAAHEHSHDAAAHEHSHDAAAHEHSHEDGACADPECTDTSHSHDDASSSHAAAAHDHSHADAHQSHGHAHDDACADPECTEASHDHSHSHSHGEHSHSHDERQQTTAATRFGITTFVYSRRRPFSRERFSALLTALPFGMLDHSLSAALGELPPPPSAAGELPPPSSASPDPFAPVLRSKGFVWLACESTIALYWSQAGKQIELCEMGKWWAAVDRSMWPKEHEGSILADMDGAWGDRRQELVFIGAGMDQAAIMEALDACLVTDEEMAAIAPPTAAAAAAV